MKALIVKMTQVKALTHWLIGALIAAGGLMQIPLVNNFVTPILAAHPKIAPAVACLLGIAALLHIPTVQNLIGYQQTTDTKLPGGGSVQQQTVVVVPEPPVVKP